MTDETIFEHQADHGPLVYVRQVSPETLIAEGAMYDWATVYMRDVVLASPALASAAYAAFSGGMAAARFASISERAEIDCRSFGPTPAVRNRCLTFATAGANCLPMRAASASP